MAAQGWGWSRPGPVTAKSTNVLRAPRPLHGCRGVPESPTGDGCAMIEFKDFSFRYASGKTNALQDINLTISDGDFVGIIGNSGAGKSTFTYAINGIVPHHYKGDFYGSVTVNGLDTVDSKPEQVAVHVGSVFQDVDAQMVASMVEDELLFGLENFGVPHGEIEQRVTEALDQIGIADLRMRDLDSLSGGQKQKVAVAAILALRPDIIVLDEPTGELDPQSSEQIYQLLYELNRQGTTIVAVEQKIGLLCRFASKLMLIDHGQVLYYGPVREVLSQTERMDEIGIHVPRIVSLHQELSRLGLVTCPAPVNMVEAENMAREALG